MSPSSSSPLKPSQSQVPNYATCSDSDADSDRDNRGGESSGSSHKRSPSKSDSLNPEDGDGARRKSLIEEDQDPLQIEVAAKNVKEKEERVTWTSLPHRRQLVILTLARLSEPLVQTSLRVSLTDPLTRDLHSPFSILNSNIFVVLSLLPTQIL